MKRITFIIVLSVISLTLNAGNIIDVYGVDSKASENIIKNYGSQVSELESWRIGTIC